MFKSQNHKMTVTKQRWSFWQKDDWGVFPYPNFGNNKQINDTSSPKLNHLTLPGNSTDKFVSRVIFPSRQMTLIQCRLKVDATLWRCIDIEPTLHKRHVPAGFTFVLRLLENEPWFSIEVFPKNPESELRKHKKKLWTVKPRSTC